MSCVHPAINTINTLRHALNESDLADWLGMELRELSALIALPHQARYRSFTIRKRSGGRRTISAPVEPLKNIQRRIARALDLDIPRSPIAVGYRPGKSIIDHALPHRNAKWILTLDLEGFFPSIGEPMLRPLLAEYLELSPAAITAIMHLCVGEGLPQGAPSSPVLSNLACVGLDRELVRIASGNNCVVTRYADDICLSSAIEDIPAAIVVRAQKNSSLGSELLEAIQRSGFKVNSRKTRISLAPAHHLVTGLVVGSGVDMPRKWKRQLRVLEHMLSRHGADKATSMLADWDHTAFRQRHPSSLAALVEGKKAFRRHLLARLTSVPIT